MAPLRDDDRRALLRLDDLRALLRAELRRPFLADFRADFLLLFLADRLADFLAPFRADDFLARLDFLDAFLADLRRGVVDRSRVLEESSKLLYDAGVEAGVGAGVFSIGSGSIQPEPDHPISIK